MAYITGLEYMAEHGMDMTKEGWGGEEFEAAGIAFAPTCTSCGGTGLLVTGFIDRMFTDDGPDKNYDQFVCKLCKTDDDSPDELEYGFTYMHGGL